MFSKVKNTKDKVRYVLEMYPETRNNDNLLCSIYWEVVDGVKSLSGIASATSAEAIRRSRQLLNAEGILLPTDPDVINKRKLNAKHMKMGFSKV